MPDYTLFSLLELLTCRSATVGSRQRTIGVRPRMRRNLGAMQETCTPRELGSLTVSHHYRDLVLWLTRRRAKSDASLCKCDFLRSLKSSEITMLRLASTCNAGKRGQGAAVKASHFLVLLSLSLSTSDSVRLAPLITYASPALLKCSCASCNGGFSQTCSGC